MKVNYNGKHSSLFKYNNNYDRKCWIVQAPEDLKNVSITTLAFTFGISKFIFFFTSVLIVLQVTF